MACARKVEYECEHYGPLRTEAIKILKKRVKSGKVEYRVSWKYHDDECGSWETEESLKRPDLVDAFEGRSPAAPPKKRDTQNEWHQRGFDRGLEVERVVEVKRDHRGRAIVGVKWRGSDAVDYVSPMEVNLKCPQAMIDYYEPLLNVDEENLGLRRRMDSNRIIGAARPGGKLHFIITWKGRDGFADLVPAEELNVKCPRAVIQYYERRVILPCDR